MQTAAPIESYEISSPEVLARMPVVSVMMMAYNHVHYIAQAIDSVLQQESEWPVELLIGDDCSTDGTRAIALEYQAKHPDLIRIITADINVGIAENYRRLLRATRGEFVAYLDGDDYWLPGKLAQQLAFLQADPACIAVYTNAITVDSDNKQLGVFNDAGDLQLDLGALLRRGNFLNNSSMVFRASARESLLKIPSSFIDYSVHLTLARSGFLRQLDQPLTAYRVNSSGSAVATSNDMVRELYWNAIHEVPRDAVTDDDYAHGIADFMRRVFYRAIRKRRWKLLRDWAPRVFSASPYGRMKILFLTFSSITRIAWKESIGLFRLGADRRRLKVLYRR